MLAYATGRASGLLAASVTMLENGIKKTSTVYKTIETARNAAERNETNAANEVRKEFDILSEVAVEQIHQHTDRTIKV